MSTQREVDAGDTLAIPETRSQKVARMASVMSRGMVNTRLIPQGLPSNMAYQWMPDDHNETTRMQLLGFIPGDQYVESQATHKSAGGINRVGDVRLWVISKEDQSILEEAQQQLVNRKHGIKDKQIEESSFMSDSQTADIESISTSKIEEVDASHISVATAQTTK